MSNWLQCYFTLNKLPLLPRGVLDANHQLFQNVDIGIGNEIDGHILCRTMTDNWEACKAALEHYGKVITLVGIIDEEGYFVGEVNQAEFEKHMQSVDDGQGNLITPIDFITAGFVGFREGKIR